MGTEPWSKLWAAMETLPQRREEALGVLNGFFGDKLHAAESDLAMAMTLRDVRGDVLEPCEVTSDDIVLFVHGLMATDSNWRAFGPESYGSRMAAETGRTPLYVCYNTGRHISENGRMLSELLEQLVVARPNLRLSIVGHSMGGLVSRSASHYGRDLAWTNALNHLVLLGVPQRGATLEQVVNIASFTLGVIPNPWTRLISWSFNQRSAGIKDLRHGYLIDEEWQHRPSADLPSFGRRYPVPLLADVEHYVVASTLTSDDTHALGVIFGDSMVTTWSARDDRVTGRDNQHLGEPPVVVAGLSHARLVQDDRVYAQLLRWLTDSVT